MENNTCVVMTQYNRKHVLQYNTHISKMRSQLFEKLWVLNPGRVCFVLQTNFC
jgi:hypothetical protein